MKRRLGIAAALAALSTCFLVAPAAPAGGVPAKLLGTWTRTITASDWKKAGYGTNVTGLFTMTVKPNGHFAVNVPRNTAFSTGVPWQVSFSARADGQMTVGPMGECVSDGFLDAGAYRWKVAGRTLTITKVRDKCAFEVRWFVGSWKRK